MSTTAPAASPLSPTFSAHSATTTLSLGATKTFVSALLVLPPSASPASSPASTYKPQARRSSISAGAAKRGLFTALAAATPEEAEPPLTAKSDGSGFPETPTSPAPVSPFGEPKPRPFGAPADGEKKKRKSSRRPATSGVVLEDKSLSIKRASVATGAGSGGVGSGISLRGRALAYVDGVQGIFKGMGIPVSTLRSTALISSHITPTLPPTPPSPSYPLSSKPPPSTPAAPASSSNLIFVVLVPLNDHPSRPPPSYTARLILESGKTPSSICFDLDSQIGNKEADGWEEERLEEALRTLTEIENKRKDGDWKGVGIVVVAYSANVDLSDDVKRKCVDAGADLVLVPPYDGVHPGVPDAIQGAIDAALHDHLAPPGSHSSQTYRDQPPSAIRRRPDPLSPPPTPPLKTVPVPPPASTTIARSTSVASAPSLANSAADAPRRASVDIGGVSLAFSRALERVDEIASLDDLDVSTERAENAESELELAELLMGMHLETQRAVSSSSLDDEHLLRPMSREKRRELVGKLDTWGFEPHMLDETDLYRCAQLMFEGAMWCEGLWELDVPKNQLDSFILSVRQIYHAPNPYHNYIHATDVLQATYTFLALAGIVPPFAALADLDGRPAQSWKRAPGGLGRAGEVLRPEDVFALVVAAIGHDAAHPGLSNVFMKNAKTPLSQIYSDSSVLENMHCLLITTLLRKHGFDFIFGPAASSTAKPPAHRSALDWTGFRKVLFSSIMATDMAMHFGWIVKLGELGDKIAEDRCSADEAEIWEDRIMICQALIKCSDISNPTRPHDVSEHWSTVLLEEWTQQAFLESGLHLPVSVVKNADAALQAKGQVGFIDLFVQPLFTAVSEVIPQLEPFSTLCGENRALWSDRLATLTEASATSIPIKPSKFSGPALDLSKFSVPCSVDSPYRTVFPYTMPGSLIAEIVDGKLPDSTLYEPSSAVDVSQSRAAPSTPSARTPLSPAPSSPAASATSHARPSLAGSSSGSQRQSFKTAYLHGVFDAAGRRKRETTASSAGSGAHHGVRVRPGHGRKRSESYSSQ